MSNRYIPLFLMILSGLVWGQQADWSARSFQITDEHRYEVGAMGPHWGHHLGHMVRSADGQLWYVDDTGNDVYNNPAVNIHRFAGDGWDLVMTVPNPPVIQQNTGTIAVGDTLYIYGLNIIGGYIEEAKFDAVTEQLIDYEQIFYTGPSTNYIGAAVSPGGTRVVWWTNVVNNDGPSTWSYVFHDGTQWNGPVQSSIPANDFSYVFASFQDDSTMWVAGEMPGGSAPNWVFKLGAGRVRLGSPMNQIVVYTQDITAHSIWVNPNDGGVHLFGQNHGGTVSYYHRPQDGSWPTTETQLPIGAVGRFRTVDSDDGRLYLVYNVNGLHMLPLQKSTLQGALSVATSEIIDIAHITGFQNTGSIWAETRCYQTNPVSALTFGFYGNLWENSGLLRSLHVVNESAEDLNLLLPTGQETFIGEETATISWHFSPDAGIQEVAIQWRHADSVWQDIETRTANDGSADWEVPGMNTSDLELRIMDADDPSVADTSARPFGIVWEFVPETPPTAQITYPVSGVEIDVAETLIATGQASDEDGYIVRHEWNTGDGEVHAGVSLSSISYAWDQDGYYWLSYRVKDNDGFWSESDSVLITVGDPTSIDPGSRHHAQPTKPEILWVAPNPTNAGVRIHLSLPSPAKADLQIFDLKGKRIFSAQLVPDPVCQDVVYHWDGYTQNRRRATSGCYLLQIHQNGLGDLRKLVLVN